MYRTWLIFKNTYWTHVTRPAYLAFVFGLPFFAIVGPLVLGLIGLVVIQSTLPPTDSRPVALVVEAEENAELFLDEASYPERPVPLQLYESEAAAVSAMAQREVQGYYLITADYWETGVITADYHPDSPFSPEVTSMVEFWLTRQIRGAVPQDTYELYREGATIVNESSDSGEASFDQDNIFQWAFLFGFIYFVRLAGMFTGGHMFGAIADESKNRTIEIILTSVSTVQFVAGKLVGLICVGLTQLIIWGSLPFLFIRMASRTATDLDTSMIFEWEYVGLAVSMLFAAYLLDQLIGAAAGILRISGGAGPQLFNMIGWATSLALVYAGYFVPRNPHAPLAVLTSFIPFTSPIVLLTRLVSSTVPLWQIVLSQIFLWGTLALFVVWLARLVDKNMVGNPERFNLRRWINRVFLGRWPALSARLATEKS